MAEEDRLCPLQMSIAGHDDLFVLVGSLKESLLEVPDKLHDGDNFPADIHMSVESNLVVAAAGSMESAAGSADSIGEAFLDIEVDILQSDGEVKLSPVYLAENILEAGDDIIPVLFCDNAGFCKHGRVGDGAGNIFTIEAPIKRDRRLKIVYHFIGCLCESPTPERITHGTDLCAPASEREPSAAGRRGLRNRCHQPGCIPHPPRR